MEFGYVGVLELIFFFLIVFLVVGPRRIIRGWRAIGDWVRRGFRRAGKSKAAQQGRGIMRGLGNVVRYYREKREE
jgi:Sec-independent protein translocase protein TatA